MNGGAKGMRLIINGKSYRLKKNIKMRLQGIALLMLGILCHKASADGAAVLMWLLGAVMLFGKIDSKR
jgi:uncharacterized membrane protein HdeD (DUF308 family)